MWQIHRAPCSENVVRGSCHRMMLQRIVFAAMVFTAGLAIGVYFSPFLRFTGIVGSDFRSFRTVHYRERMSQFSVLHGAADVVMLGDSITELGMWDELLPQLIVLNRGIAGDTTYGVMERLAEVKDHKPKLIFLMIGVNDLFRKAEPPQVAHNIEKILDALGTRTILMNVLHTADKSLNERIIALNSLLQRQQVDHLDLNTDLAPTGILLPKYTLDGVHLTGDAYVFWRDKMKPFLPLH